jgi:hypothetical protein
MGYGGYSHDAHRSLVAGRASSSGAEVFTQTQCHPLMNPSGLKYRESRDGPDHPNSLAIAFALDVTGSMGNIPELLAKKELPTFMKLLTDCKIADPQLLFMAVGDAVSDSAAFQIGQFESTAELMDQWLTRSYLEGGGGGSGEESYELAFYSLAQHTDSDCWGKRKRRGYLFMTGDEYPYPVVSRHQVASLFGEVLDEDIPIEEVIAAAAESYHLFFLIPDLHRRARCEARWRELLGDNVICMESYEDTCAVAASIVALTERVLPDLDAVAKILVTNGIAKERVGAVVRALASYAGVADVNSIASYVGTADPAVAAKVDVNAPAALKPTWWKRLFS